MSLNSYQIVNRLDGELSSRGPVRRPTRSLSAAAAVALMSLLVALLGGVASASNDPVQRARAVLADATARRIASEARVGDARAHLGDVEKRITDLGARDERLTRELTKAREAMKQFVISAYIEGGRADVARVSLDPTEVQSLVWKSTLSAGQAASADEAARVYEQLKAAATPERLQAATELDEARQRLTDASNDAIQAGALERDAEAALAREIAAAKERAVAQAAAERERRSAAAAERSAAVGPAASPSASSANAGGPAASTSSNSSQSVNPGAGLRGDPTPAESSTLARIRRCESHGNYSIVSASGRYRGAYQFDYRTWGGVGGSGDPAAASPAEQDYRALLLLRSRGTRPWPVCGR